VKRILAMLMLTLFLVAALAMTTGVAFAAKRGPSPEGGGQPKVVHTGNGVIQVGAGN
jgi:hypothetical protein